MNRRSLMCLCGSAALALPLFAAGFAPLSASADDTEVSNADRAFVAKVSQGGMFEVEASRVAAEKGGRQDIADIGFTEVHDHQLVGAKLRSIATSAGISVEPTLNAEFQQRLDRLRGLSGKAFDNAYIKEMDAIHDADGAAFAEEARSGGHPALRDFAAETVLIVKRHLGALHALPLEGV
jgi:putative membrane protein